MSDAAVTSIVTGVITIASMLIGFMTLWVKVRYGIDKAEAASVEATKQAIVKATDVEKKIDNNTVISTSARDAAVKAEEQTNGMMSRYEEQLANHHTRITVLEGQIAVLKASVDTVVKNIDSTRHEMRGHLQTITAKLDTNMAVMMKSITEVK